MAALSTVLLSASSAFVPSLADYSVDPEKLVTEFPEFFTYAAVRLVSTLEVFYSKLTGKEAKWGNTGGIGSGSIDEIPNVLIVILMVVGYIRSVSVFLWVDHGQDLHFILPLWGFGAVMLGMFSPFARVSLQEFLGWGYETLNFSLVLYCVGPPLVIIFVVVLKQAELGGHDAY